MRNVCDNSTIIFPRTKHEHKAKVFPYWLPSDGPGADPGVQAVSPHATTLSTR